MLALQHVERARDHADAQQMLDGCRLLDGFLGGRVLINACGWWELNDRPTVYRMQAFFVDAPDVVQLPDDTIRVYIPPSQHLAMGIL